MSNLSLGVREAGVLSIAVFVVAVGYFVATGVVEPVSAEFVGFIIGFSVYMAVFFAAIRISRAVEERDETSR